MLRSLVLAGGFLSLLCFSGCQKGKRLPEQTPVVVDIPLDKVAIQTPYYVNYVHHSEAEVSNAFRNQLAGFLKQNNVLVVAPQIETPYRVSISITAREGSWIEYLEDTCEYGYHRDREVALHDLYFKVLIHLYNTENNPVLVGSWEFDCHREEKAKFSNNGRCPQRVEVRTVNCDLQCMMRRIAKRCRKVITKAIYRYEDYG